jgi:hypothetical protein
VVLVAWFGVGVLAVVTVLGFAEIVFGVVLLTLGGRLRWHRREGSVRVGHHRSAVTV